MCFGKAAYNSVPVLCMRWCLTSQPRARLTKRSSDRQEGDLVNDGAAAHGAVVGQTGPLPNNTIHSRLVDHAKTTRKRQGLKRNGNESMKVGFNDTKLVKYANTESITTAPSGKFTAQSSISKHTVSLRWFHSRLSQREEWETKGKIKEKTGEWRPGRNSGWPQPPDVSVSF